MGGGEGRGGGGQVEQIVEQRGVTASSSDSLQ